MSRCFPFPPPGYEKKDRTDNPDLLKKEKQRERKHKKGKDKEKRENKEKKDKDGSDEKHRGKKDKKEKHREKKKDKDRDKDKGKNSSSDEKRLSRKSEGHDGEKIPNEKKLPGHNGEKFVPKEKEKDKDRNSNSGEKIVPMQFSGYSREYSQNRYLAGDSKDSKFVQELGRRVGDDGIGNHLAEKFSTERRRDEGIVKLLARSTHSFGEGKEKEKDERGVGDEARFSGNVMVRNPAVQTRVEGVYRQLEKDSETRTEVKERTKQKEGDDKRGDKSKYFNREKNKQGKEKEKEKEEKERMKIEHKIIEKDKLKHINDDERIATHNMKTLYLPKDGNKNAISEGNPRKRKELETNGFCHANNIKPGKLPRSSSSSQSLTEGSKLPKSALLPPLMEISKLPRPTLSSHSFPGNGRILEPCQTPALCTSDKGRAADNLKADNREGKLNSAARPQLTAVQTDQISELSTKPPHPDAKYLSQVLLVPKMEYCSNFDGHEEWLFQISDSHSKMPKLGSSVNDEIPEVWAEAMRIESADVCALPYVVPY